MTSRSPTEAAAATEATTVQALKQIVRLNNEGSSLLRTSVVKGRDAMACFQSALATAVDLAEACQQQEQEHQQQPPGSSATMEALCRFAAVPIPCGSSVFYFYNQVVYLNPAGLEQAVAGTGPSIWSLSRLYLVVLLLNASLACYQLGHACLLQPRRPADKATNHYAQKAESLFRKALELYSQLTSLTASDFFAGMPQEDTLTTFVAFLSLAAANNYCLLCLELGFVDHSRQAQPKLVGLLQIIKARCHRLPPCHQEIFKEFFLNTTVMNVTGFHIRLAAGAA